MSLLKRIYPLHYALCLIYTVTYLLFGVASSSPLVSQVLGDCASDLVSTADQSIGEE